jgi:sarcosine oxidase subunit delta
MLLIPCPWCGPRDEPEFTYGGEPAARPGPAAEVSDTDWAGYLYLRTNEKGAHRELWCHSAGCGQWFVLERDTVTHAIIAAVRP